MDGLLFFRVRNRVFVPRDGTELTGNGFSLAEVDCFSWGRRGEGEMRLREK